MAFKKATKEMAKAKIALTGPSGSGKTLSALLLARGLIGPTGRCAVLDTENSSASLYVDKFNDWSYDVDAIANPYTIEKFLNAIKEAVDQKYDCLVIDSATHAWAGSGGLLERKEALDSRGGNSFTNWGAISKLQERFKAYILQAPIHIIVTMRSKQEYIIEQSSGGKSIPKKVGLAPIQRDGMEYEFTTVFDIGMDHQFMVSKDRTGLFDGMVDFISIDTGKRIHDWLYKGPVASTSLKEVDDIDSALEQETPADTEPKEFREARERRETIQKDAKAMSAIDAAKGPPDDPPEDDPPPSRLPPSSKPPVKNHADDVVARQKAKNQEEMKRRQAQEPPPPENFLPGDYIIDFGKNKGKRIKDLSAKDIRYLRDWAKSEQRPGAKLIDFMKYAEDHLIMLQDLADQNRFDPGK